jgi:sn-glycerol 3-phosphate transport system substrate-binding protein
MAASTTTGEKTHVRTRSRAAALIAASLLVAAGGGLAGTTATASGGVTEIGVSIGFTDYRLDWFEEVIDAFEAEHPEYTIVVEGFNDYETLLQSVTLAAQQGNPPAIAQYFEVATQEARDAVTADGEPLFASVEEAIGGRDEILGEPVVLGDIVSAVADYYTIDDEFTSMPWNTSSTLLYANDSYLEAAGVDGTPETWADLEAACEAIMALDDAPSGCISWPNHGWFFEQSIAQQGGLLANNDNGRSGRADEVFLDSPEMMAWVEYWAGLAESGHYVYTGVQRDWDGTKNAFGAQEIAFILTSSGDGTALVADGKDAGFDVLAGRMPYNGEVDYAGNLIGGATLWLINGLDETTTEGALAFMQFLNNPENAADWHRISNYIPITNAAVELLEEEGWFDENPYARVATDQLALADGSPAARGAILGGFVQIRDVMTLAMEDVLVSGADPEARFAEAAEEAQTVLEDYNSLFATDEE